MKTYQLVVEFEAENMEEIERLFDCELKLQELLQSGELDGNDIGDDVFNLFITTKEPLKCFEEVFAHAASMNLLPVSSGYRGEDGDDDYIRVWPKNDDTPFELH